MHKRSLCRRAVSVRPSVTFVDYVKKSNRVLRIFSPSGSQTILVFPCQTAWQYSNGNPLTSKKDVFLRRKTTFRYLHGPADLRVKLSKICWAVIVHTCNIILDYRSLQWPAACRRQGAGVSTLPTWFNSCLWHGQSRAAVAATWASIWPALNSFDVVPFIPV